MKKLIPLIVLTLFSALDLMAQEGKLKNVQTASVYAPANLKVDGKLNEWDDNFQAYNKTTQIFYTVCNDDKYLYLVIKSIDQTNNNKIIAGGISFIINTDGKKKEKNAFTLTFPVIPRAARQRGGGRGGAGGGAATARLGGGGFGRGAGQAPPDSAAIAYAHQQTIEKAKEIGVLGFKDITDTLISIYNEYSIKAALGYDKLNNYDYELAVPLKLLNISPGDNKEIAYDIKVNGLPMPQGFGGDNTRGAGIAGADGGAGGAGGGAGGAGGGGGFGGGGGGRGGGGGGRGGAGGGGGGNRGGNNPGQNLDMFAPTDFWGKYVLAKK